MKTPPFEIKMYGPNALLLEWPKKVELKILMDILAFQEYLRKNHLSPDFWEFVPVYHSLTLINRSGDVEMETIAKKLAEWYSTSRRTLGQKPGAGSFRSVTRNLLAWTWQIRHGN